MTGPMLASRVMKARRPGTCPLCQGPIRIGDSIAKTVKWAHTGCVVASLYNTSTKETRRAAGPGACSARC
jgi:hypothetical protein